MTQRTFIAAPSVRGRADRPTTSWIPFGEGVAAVIGTLFGPSGARTSDLPPEALRDRDPALYESLLRAERTRLALDADRRPLLY